jgi:hypothetical protein
MFFVGHSTSVTTPSQGVVKETGTSSDRQPSQISGQAESHSSRVVDLTNTAESQTVAVNTPSTIIYPKTPYRALETAVAGGIHSEALLNLARSRAAIENAGTLK